MSCRAGIDRVLHRLAWASGAAHYGPAAGDRATKDINYQIEIFSNRLKKRKKHLWKWARRNEITCFRVYQRDIPEIPFTVDIYDGRLHIAEYDRPNDRSPEEHAAWSDAMVRAAADALTVPMEKVFVKFRQVQLRDRRYQKLDDEGHAFPVKEGGLEFLVNLSDYIDTGLFLDHRITRDMVRSAAAARRVLNLYAYTGSFSVYAADGGATSTTSVDLSNTYCAWARDNLSRNGFIGPGHRIIASDVEKFLDAEIKNGGRYDLIVLDPPTFSNSKKMQGVLDIQRDHTALINRCLRILSGDGLLLFSTNFRRLKFENSALEGAAAEEITDKTTPEDFAGKVPHRCWIIHPKARRLQSAQPRQRRRR